MEKSTAQSIFDSYVRVLDEREWHYEKREEEKVVAITINGEDIPMRVLFRVREDVPVATIISFMPGKFPEDKRIDGAIASAAANAAIPGAFKFEYDFSDGEVSLVTDIYFQESYIDQAVLDLKLSLALDYIDDYNDKFLMLSKGMIDLKKFLEFVNQ